MTATRTSRTACVWGRRDRAAGSWMRWLLKVSRRGWRDGYPRWSRHTEHRSTARSRKLRGRPQTHCCLPLFAGMTTDEQDTVVAALAEAIRA